MAGKRLRIACFLCLWAPLDPEGLVRDMEREQGDDVVRPEEPYRLAMDWLLRHQNPDGSWSSAGYTDRCSKKRGPCTNADVSTKPKCLGSKLHDVGVTGLAVLAFTGYGHTHQAGVHRDYVDVLRNAMAFLKRAQIRESGDPKLDGYFRSRHSLIHALKGGEDSTPWLYDHAVVTTALGELLALSGDARGLKRPVEKAARACIAALRTRSGLEGIERNSDTETVVMGWFCLALKTAHTCRLLKLIEQPSETDLTWGLKHVAERLNPLDRPDDRSGNNPAAGRVPYRAAVGVLALLFSGESRSRPAVQRTVVDVLKHQPRWSETEGTIHFDYWYFGSLAMFQYGGGLWREWTDALGEALCKHQRLTPKHAMGCVHGSWDPLCEWAPVGGRVYATALATLALEVYYRYERAREVREF